MNIHQGPPGSPAAIAKNLLRVFLLSFIVLFLELSLIRWLPSQVRALSYFKNLVLISSFLGLGLGSMLTGRARSLLWLFPVLFLLEVGAALLLGQFIISGTNSLEEHLWLLYWDLPSNAPSFPLWVAVPLFFVLNTLTFVPLGQLVGEALVGAGNPILAYSANLLGSLAGTAGFVGVSFAEWGPRLWFAPALAGLAWFARARRASFGLLAATTLIVTALPLDRGLAWSPYYGLRRTPIEAGITGIFTPEELGTRTHQQLGYYLTVNGSFHEAALNLSADISFPALRQLREDYGLPYRYLRDHIGIRPRDVLIIGAGTGNDAQIALEQGAEFVDVVEIDPVILRWGQEIHPNRPYDDRRVRRHVADARNFLNHASREYDLVVFGTLDSQTLLSALSTIRLDNYVYTVESLEQAKAVLKPRGALALYFWVEKDWIRKRLVKTIEAAFGCPPVVLRPLKPRLFNLVLIATAAPAEGSSSPSLALDRDKADVQESTDDWPYLYQQDRKLSPFYTTMIVVLASLSALAVLIGVRAALPSDQKGLKNFHLPLFFQGAGFLLLETKGISTLSLVFGSTWTVNAIVIGAILLIILVATLGVYWLRPRRVGLIWAGIAATLVVGYLVPTSALLSPDLGARVAGSCLVVLSPILFSSMFFAVLFRDSADVAWAYGSNLLGAVLGGLAEFGSVLTGFRALNLLALLLYALAFAAHRFGPRQNLG